MGVNEVASAGNAPGVTARSGGPDAGRFRAAANAVSGQGAVPARPDDPGRTTQPPAPSGVRTVIVGIARAIGTFDAAHGRVLTRLSGAAQVVGGVAEGFAAAGLAGVGGAATATGVGAAPGIPTLIAAGALAVNALDNAQAGLRTVVTGQAQHTLASEAAGAGARSLGASEQTSERISAGVDVAQGLLGGLGAAAAARSVARREVAMAPRLAGPAEAAPLAPTHAGTIRNANPTGGQMNCANCVVASDAILRGAPASALPGGPFPLSVLERSFASRFGSATMTEIETTLRSGGPGTAGVVFGYRPDMAVGHVFNAVNQNGTVRFLDGQIGGAANTSYWSHFQYMPIAPIR